MLESVELGVPEASSSSLTIPHGAGPRYCSFVDPRTSPHRIATCSER